jgi:hypothetical protein
MIKFSIYEERVYISIQFPEKKKKKVERARPRSTCWCSLIDLEVLQGLARLTPFQADPCQTVTGYHVSL